jgi:hypothetical protein
MQVRSFLISFLINALVMFVLFMGLMMIFAIVEKVTFMHIFKEVFLHMILNSIAVSFSVGVVRRRKELNLPIAQKELFITELCKYAQEAKYEKYKDENNLIAFRQGQFWGSFFAKFKIKIKQSNGSVSFIGPIHVIEKIETRISENSHLKKFSRRRTFREATLFTILVLLWIVPAVSMKTKPVRIYLCNKGFGEQCYDLAKVESKNKNLEAAKHLYEKACSFGADSACTASGKLLEPSDIDEAMKYYELAGEDSANALADLCFKGNGKACFMLGDLSLKGKDKAEAKIWYQFACQGKFVQGCEKIKELN